MADEKNQDPVTKCENSNDNNEIGEKEVCAIFIPRKNRFCKMKPVTGFKYCPQHSHLCPEQNSKMGIRIPCPLDPSHTCYLSKLEKHKKKCNAREKDKPPYYKQNVNAGDISESSPKISIHDVSDEELLCLINKVEEHFKKVVPPLMEIKTLHPFLEKEIQESEAGTHSLKHIHQQASLLYIMEKYNLLNKGTCFVEFGAGKGQLMYWVVLVQFDRNSKTYVLVDRAAQRYKFDNKFKEDSNVKLERIRIDIEHLNLRNVDCIKEQPQKVVGISKHLCGAATDLALRCMLETLTSGEKDKTSKSVPLGLVMAQCCHHCCMWKSYVGKEFMEKIGFSERNFQLMCCIASWATCGLRKTNIPCEGNSSTEIQHGDHNEDLPSVDQRNRYVKLGLTHSEREEIGRKCKRLIDMGRVHYLQQHNLISELVIYVDSEVTLENVALVAVSESV